MSLLFFFFFNDTATTEIYTLSLHDALPIMELAFEREYISTFVLCTGDSDFTPLVHKLRGLNKRVIGVGVEKSTSALLPPACDEFLYYDRLEGVEVPAARTRAPRAARAAAE